MSETVYEDESSHEESQFASTHCLELVKIGGYKFCDLPIGHEGQHEAVTLEWDL